jgi:hypothetical protein
MLLTGKTKTLGSGEIEPKFTFRGGVDFGRYSLCAYS